MIYLLDTNACIVYLNRPMSGVRSRLETLSPEDVAVCSIVKAELFYGAMRSNNPERTLALQQEFINRFISLPFDDRSAIISSHIRAQLAAFGTRALRPSDCRYRTCQQLNFSHSQHP